MIEVLQHLASQLEEIRKKMRALADDLPDPDPRMVEGEIVRDKDVARLGALELALENIQIAAGELVYAIEVTPDELEREHKRQKRGVRVPSSMLP